MTTMIKTTTYPGYGTPSETLSKKPEIIFVADFFLEDFKGGAELTTDALIKTCPYPYECVKAVNLNPGYVLDYKDAFWIFGNFTYMRYDMFEYIKEKLKYVVIEYDYKYCRLRSAELCAETFKRPCECHQRYGQEIAKFYSVAQKVFFMSQEQRARYELLFPNTLIRSEVLSSVFDDATLKLISELRAAPAEKNALGFKKKRKGWVIQKSNSWIKGYYQALKYCAEHKIKPIVLDKTPYEETLRILSRAEGLIYLPNGADTCPRLVIEAKLLGCKLVMNKNVQHQSEAWFDNHVYVNASTGKCDFMENYLKSRTTFFWEQVKTITCGY